MKKILLILRFKSLNPYKSGLSVTFFVVSVGFIAVFSMYPIKLQLASQGLFQAFTHPINEHITANLTHMEMFYWFLSVVLVRPLTEELAFRYPLSAKSNTFILGLSFFMVFTCLFLFEAFEIYIFSDFYFIAIFISISILVSYVFRRFFTSLDTVSNDSRKLALFSSFLFALFHLNIISNQPSMIAYPVILLPYFVDGYLYSYLRVFYGFRYGMLAHSMSNFIVLCINII